MSKILIDVATVKIALEALNSVAPRHLTPFISSARTALREALAEQPAQDDPCPGCRKGGVCRTPKCGRLRLPVDHPCRSEQPAQQQSCYRLNCEELSKQVMALKLCIEVERGFNAQEQPAQGEKK